MPAIVVAPDLEFRDSDHARSEYHSFANLINVVHAELQLLERMCAPEEGLRPAIRLCEAATWAFRDPGAAEEHGLNLAEFGDRVRTTIARLKPIPRYEEDAAEAMALVDEVLGNADLRVQELLARHGVARALLRHSPEQTMALLLSGARESAGGPEAVRADLHESLSTPQGLLEAIGRLAGELAGAGGAAQVRVYGDESAEPGVKLYAPPVSFALAPASPPASLDSTDKGETARALVALIWYLAAPAFQIEVDPAGSPIVRVRQTPA